MICDCRASDELGPINIYEIYADVCMPKHALAETAALARALGQSPGGLSARIANSIGASYVAHGRNGRDSSAEDPNSCEFSPEGLADPNSCEFSLALRHHRKPDL